jgi:hypothetical protein
MHISAYYQIRKQFVDVKRMGSFKSIKILRKVLKDTVPLGSELEVAIKEMPDMPWHMECGCYGVERIGQHRVEILPSKILKKQFRNLHNSFRSWSLKQAED